MRSRGFGHAEVFAILATFSFAVARFVPVLGLFPACPLKAITGLPCLSCGMTHAFVHLAHGEVAAALAANPLGALIAAGAWSYALLGGFRWMAALPLPRFQLSARHRRAALVAAGAAAALNWIYLVAVA